ncbi:MAG: VWA domain-containing protein [Planctomycetales bacterium]|nr:VWA domain-containing protein [Planctomycetales bacterium]MCA9183452.1 VWA domain-containing protein [Planctomycetales bacterium]
MKRQFPNRRGAMMILVAVSFIILLVGAVFSVDVAYMHMVRAELRTATDAAARAGSEELARSQSPTAARAAAAAVAERNKVAGNGLTLAPGDIQVGSLQPNGGKFKFVADVGPFTAVRVVGRRESTSADGAVSLFFAKVFSANQFEPVQAATASANVRDVALVLDISGSMGYYMPPTNRLDALKNAVSIFLSEVAASSPSTQISLTAYSTTSYKILNLTNNFAAVQKAVDGFTPQNYTAIGKGLLMGSDSLANDPLTRPSAFKTIILMTDGQQNTGPGPDVTVATPIARGQTVHTITFSSEANQTLMRQVAQSTQGGIHIHADDAADLADAFRSIARTLAVTLVE